MLWYVYTALYESTAWQLASAEVIQEEQSRDPGATVSFVNVRSRQVMMPTFIAQYSAFGQDFKVYINGTTGEWASLGYLFCRSPEWCDAYVAMAGHGFSSQQTVFPAPQFAALRKRILFLIPFAPLLTRLLFYPPALALSVASYFILRTVHRYDMSCSTVYDSITV